MNDTLKNFTLNFSKYFKNKKGFGIIIALGIIGILLIGASEWFANDEIKSSKSSSQELSVNQYIKMLEEKTEKMLLSVEGAGKCKIMITAATSAAQQYAVDESISNDNEKSSQENRDKSENQTQIVMIEGENGRKQALVVKVIEPEIRGVLVLCEGADNPTINEKVTQAVKTVLGVTSNKICVIKLK